MCGAVLFQFVESYLVFLLPLLFSEAGLRSILAAKTSDSTNIKLLCDIFLAFNQSTTFSRRESDNDRTDGTTHSESNHPFVHTEPYGH